MIMGPKLMEGGTMRDECGCKCAEPRAMCLRGRYQGNPVYLSRFPYLGILVFGCIQFGIKRPAGSGSITSPLMNVNDTDV